MSAWGRLLVTGLASGTLLALAPGRPLADDRVDEAQLFGAVGQPGASEPAARPDASPLRGAPPSGLAPRLQDTLTMGGASLLLAQVAAAAGTAPGDSRLSAPMLVDGWIDARPSERVRGMVVGRLHHDPAAPRDATSFSGSAAAATQVALDQLWVRFDVARSVFVTAGKQHVKWGTGRFWSPTDFLHVDRRDPLALVDQRAGVAMLKLHVPWEKRGWNLYGIAALEDDEPVTTAGRVAAGGRAEIVVGTVELGVDALARRGRRARLGADVSAGVGDLDVYAEVALAPAERTWRRRANADPAQGLAGRYEPVEARRRSVSATMGGTWAWKYSEQDLLQLGAEYFFQEDGYDDPAVYPWLLLNQAFRSLRLGRHYAAVTVTLPGPGALDDASFGVTILANVSDRSALGRLDASYAVTPDLSVQAFVGVNAGRAGGEFRFALDMEPVAIGDTTTPALHVARPIADVGVALRLRH